MKNNFNLLVFTGIFFLSLFLPKSEAAQELPFANPQVAISMDFQDVSLKDILKIFSIQSGLNFIASGAVKDRKFTLYFENVSIKDALDKIFKANNLSYELDKRANIFIVNDLGAPEVQTATKVFYLKYASVYSSSLITEKNRSTNITNLSSASGSGGTTTTTTSLGTAEGIAGVIKKLLTDKGQVVEDPRTNSLIVTDIPNRVLEIGKIIVSLDVPQPQVLLEVEMLDVFKDATDKIGLKFGTSPLTLNTVLTGASWASKFPSGSIFGDTSKNFANGSFGVNTGGTNSAVSTYQIVLDFLKTQTGTKFLARPKIITLNNETAEIKITTNEAIGTSSVQQGQGTAASTTKTAERTETGVLLKVTPQINLDTGEITMFVIPAVAESSTGGTFDGVTFKDPEIRYTKSMIRVKDGETIVLGGLLRKNFSETITRLPFLSDIPILGKLFTHRYKDKDRDRELLVFITPHIIVDNAGSTQLAQLKKGALADREQDTVSETGDRQVLISESLERYQKKAR
ncbi:MAG TPA: secretin N-terminal domain-containing protein [Candidatus Omnitrophota bacterium]|nr:secretin N-terminal domain-containing protein [Candidatus Omnitrophota bacterium]